MSKNNKNATVGPNTPQPYYESGYILDNYHIEHLTGRLLTLIEALGLRESQEKSLKDLVKQEVWKLTDGCFIIPGSARQELYDKYRPTATGSLPGQIH